MKSGEQDIQGSLTDLTAAQINSAIQIEHDIEENQLHKMHTMHR